MRARILYAAVSLAVSSRDPTGRLRGGASEAYWGDADERARVRFSGFAHRPPAQAIWTCDQANDAYSALPSQRWDKANASTAAALAQTCVRYAPRRCLDAAVAPHRKARIDP